MLIMADKKFLFQDRYQALILPVPVSGIFRHRTLLRLQSLYPEFYTLYKQACERSELALGTIWVYETQRDLAGLGVGSALSKPKFLVAMAVTEFSENPPHLSYLKSCLQQLEPILLRWGRYEGIRRVAVLAADELIMPSISKDNDEAFEKDILPVLEKHLMPMSGLTVVLYR